MTTARAFACLLALTLAISANAQCETCRGARSTSRRQLVYFEKLAEESQKQVRFMGRGGGYALFVTNNEAVVVLQKHDRNKLTSDSATVRMKLSGASKHASAHGEGVLEAKSNYFIGNDRSKWRTNVTQYARVRVAEVYRGIDVVYYGNEGRFEYDFIVNPGADPRQI